jgi:hypothetical protein
MVTDLAASHKSAPRTEWRAPEAQMLSIQYAVSTSAARLYSKDMTASWHSAVSGSQKGARRRLC